jgi:hypothetical protein
LVLLLVDLLLKLTTNYTKKHPLSFTGIATPERNRAGRFSTSARCGLLRVLASLTPPCRAAGAGTGVTSGRDARGLLVVASVAQHSEQTLADDRRLGAARPHKALDAYVLAVEQLTEALQGGGAVDLHIAIPALQRLQKGHLQAIEPGVASSRTRRAADDLDVVQTLRPPMRHRQRLDRRDLGGQAFEQDVSYDRDNDRDMGFEIE